MDELNNYHENDMDIDINYNGDDMDIDYNNTSELSKKYTNVLPKNIKIKYFKKLEEFDIIEYNKKIDIYDIKMKSDEIVFPTRLKNYIADEINNPSINLEMAIIYLSNAINKINKKYKYPIIKCLRREDMILFDLTTGNIKKHRESFNILQSIRPRITFNEMNIDTTSKMTIFIPIPIILDNTFGHLNILVINNNNKTITLYEPLGIQGIGSINNLSKLHQDRFRKTLKFIEIEIKKDFPDYKFIKTHNDYDGIQTRSDEYSRKVYNISEKHCVAWCIYLCLFRIFNMHLDTEIPASFILNSIYNEKFSDDYLNLFIRKFVAMVRADTDNYQSDMFSTVESGPEFFGYDIIQNIDNLNV